MFIVPQNGIHPRPYPSFLPLKHKKRVANSRWAHFKWPEAVLYMLDGVLHIITHATAQKVSKFNWNTQGTELLIEFVWDENANVYGFRI